MRRVAAIAAFALVLTVPVWAQHGGGHGGGGGGHAGGFGGHSGGFSGGHAAGGGFSSGMHSSSSSGAARAFTPPASSRRSYSPRGFSNNRIGNRGIANRGHSRNGIRLRTYGFNNRCYGYPCRGGYAYPWAYGGFYDPYWWWDSDSSYDDDYNQDVATAAQMNRDNLDEQRMLRQEESDGDQDAYAQAPRAPRAMRPGNARDKDPQPGAAIMANTVLVFRDEHKQEVSNYAIVGQTLWNFAPGHTQKIPLSDLDLPATTKANEELGVTFRVPGFGEGQ